MPPKKKNSYEENRKRRTQLEVEAIKKTLKNNDKYDVCEGDRCTDRMRPINEFTYKSNGTKSTCIACREKYKKKSTNASQEAKLKASRKYNAKPYAKILQYERSRRFKEKNPEKNKEYAKNYYEKNKEEINTKRRNERKEMNELMEAHIRMNEIYISSDGESPESE